MNIFQSIQAVMREIGAIGKNSKNTQQGFMFRGIDAVMNGINPALTKYGVFIVPEILEQTREERQTKSGNNLIYSVCRIKYTFYAQDGSCISATVIGEGMDSGDKATNKAMSIAFKYACFQVFCIPTEEMADPDAECHEVKPKAEKKEEKSEDDQRVSKEDLNKLALRCADDRIPAIFLAQLYKVEDLSKITYKHLKNIYANWGKIVDLAATQGGDING